MTRINATIPPENLCDQHLLAEHREIVRLRHLVKSKSAVTSSFTLGKGHVLYFKDKLGWVRQRYEELYSECLQRGFNVQYLGGGFSGIPAENLAGTPHVTPKEKQQLLQRIIERCPKSCRYHKKEITLNQYKQILCF